MNLEYIESKADRAICALVKVNLSEKQVALNKQEIDVLKLAKIICEKAEALLIDYYHDPEMITDFGLAEHALSDILENCKP